jgi:hypothetical protein
MGPSDHATRGACADVVSTTFRLLQIDTFVVSRYPLSRKTCCLEESIASDALAKVTLKWSDTFSGPATVD